MKTKQRCRLADRFNGYHSRRNEVKPEVHLSQSFRLRVFAAHDDKVDCVRVSEELVVRDEVRLVPGEVPDAHFTSRWHAADTDSTTEVEFREKNYGAPNRLRQQRGRMGRGNAYWNFAGTSSMGSLTLLVPGNSNTDWPSQNIWLRIVVTAWKRDINGLNQVLFGLPFFMIYRGLPHN